MVNHVVVQVDAVAYGQYLLLLLDYILKHGAQEDQVMELVYAIDVSILEEQAAVTIIRK
jgi:hypothetical protein